MRGVCSDVVNQLVQSINGGEYLKVEMQMVGSGAKHLETQNEDEPVDLDYNINIIDINGNINDCQKIKEYIRKEFDNVLKSIGWGNCKDSSSVLTTEKRHFKQGNQTEFSIDVAIVYKRKGSWQRLIHEKTGNTSQDTWFWNTAPNSKGLLDKANWLKENGYWNETRETFISKKNLYLRKNDYNHPSFNCYIEAVNEVYSKYQ